MSSHIITSHIISKRIIDNHICSLQPLQPYLFLSVLDPNHPSILSPYLNLYPYQYLYPCPYSSPIPGPIPIPFPIPIPILIPYPSQSLPLALSLTQPLTLFMAFPSCALAKSSLNADGVPILGPIPAPIPDILIVYSSQSPFPNAGISLNCPIKGSAAATEANPND